jgi:uncharacterized protein (TIGR02246 family)
VLFCCEEENNMKTPMTVFAMVAIAFMMTACNRASDTRDADIQAIRNDEVQWNQDYGSKDLDKIAAHYAGDAILMVPGMPPSSGSEAIRSTLKEMVADPALSLKFQSSKIEVAKSGDLAYLYGQYTMAMTDPQTRQVINDHGSYVTTYRKQPDGTWKAVADIATSEVPPPASPKKTG